MSALKDIKGRREDEQREAIKLLENRVREVREAIEILGRVGMADNYKEARDLVMVVRELLDYSERYKLIAWELRDLSRIHAENEGIAR